MAAHQLIVEPARRGTASCIALALARLSKHHDASEQVVFLHADHHITDEEGFVRTVRAATAAAVARHSIALIGLKPTYPATGFGYIQCGLELAIEQGLPVYKVSSFEEKPSLEVAERYIESGEYLWNLGLFAAPIVTFEREMDSHAPELGKAYRKLAATEGDNSAQTKEYLLLENLPIDTALIEKTPNLVVIPGSFDWADIGSFFDLHKILSAHAADGNALAGEVHMIDCEDSMIHATTKPIIAIGLSGIIVVDTPEGLLVCTKEQSQLVGELSKKLAASHQN
jgi:mannose-1-phosphate guanylyltransferase